MNNLLILLQAVALAGVGGVLLAVPERIRQAGLDYYSKNLEGPYRAQVMPWLEDERSLFHMRVAGGVLATIGLLLIVVLVVL